MEHQNTSIHPITSPTPSTIISRASRAKSARVGLRANLAESPGPAAAFYPAPSQPAV
jgi:hypothetical protein